MKLLFLGDSITDMGRSREPDGVCTFDYGTGYVFHIAGELLSRPGCKYQIVNRGISGDTVANLYARVKPDVWAQKPDVLTVLVGINDLWHNIDGLNRGVELPRFRKIYRNLLEETREQFPDMPIILMDPFVLHGTATDGLFDEFSDVKHYAQAVREVAAEFGVHFLPLQAAFDEACSKIGPQSILYDGVHPGPVGAKIIAEEWVKLFDRVIQK